MPKDETSTSLTQNPPAALEEDERTLSYRVRSSSLALAFIMALSPIWLLWSAWAALSLAVWNCTQFGLALNAPNSHLLMCFFYCLLPLIGLSAAAVCLDTTVAYTKTKLRLPSRFLLELRGRLSWSWDLLAKVDFRDREGGYGHSQSMTLLFKSGASAALDLAGLKREDIKELIQAIQSFAPQVEFLPKLADLDLNLISGFDAGLDGVLYPSFTQLWEDELTNRFGSTIFVPLDPGAILQDGAITVTGPLCFGGLSAVYMARRNGQDGHDLDQNVILKEAVLPVGCDPILREKALQMFGREASILATLDHERIARVRDYFVEKSRHYIVLDHIEGIDLRRFVHEQGPQPAAVVLRWLLEITQILRYLHQHAPPVVHRDVSPDNIVMARDGHLTLIDFGAANNLVGTATGTLVGKQSYISPEQFRGKAGAQSDLYSLGATIFFALTGHDPEPLSQLSPTIPEGLPPSEIFIYKSLIEIIQSLTQLDIADRIKSAADLEMQLQIIRESIDLLSKQTA